MALVKVEFKAGVVKDESDLSSEGAFVDSDMARFVQGKPQVIDGWEKMLSATVTGVPRAVHGWSDLSGLRHMAIGTSTSLWLLSEGSGGGYSLRKVEALVFESVTVTAVNGSPSFRITLAGHRFSVGDPISFTTAVTVGGRTLGLSYSVASVEGPNDFRITHNQNATSSGSSGASIEFDRLSFIETTGERTGSLPTDPFVRDGGVGSETRVTHSLAHGLRQGDRVTFAGSNSATVNGTWTVTQILSDTQYTINHTGLGTSPVGGSSVTFRWAMPPLNGLANNPISQTASFGGDLRVTASSPHGLATGDTVTISGLTGFMGSAALAANGTHTVTNIISSTVFAINVHWSGVAPNQGGPSGVWSKGSSAPTFAERHYSLDNFGEVLLVLPRGHGLYLVQPGPYDEMVEAGDMSSSTPWATGTGWTVGSGVATKTAGTGANLSQAADNFRPGYVYELNFTLTRSAGEITFQIFAGESPTLIDVGAPDWDAGGTYRFSFVCPADPSDFVFVADAAFAGTVDDVSIRMSSNAEIIDTAPDRSLIMWVDPNSRVVNLAGTVEADGDYNPMCVRNSAQENFRVWVPDTNNIADEVILGRGSRVVGAKLTRQQTLVWSDAALFSQQFMGANASPYRYLLMGNGCGLIGRNAAAEINGAVFWLASNKQFYIFNGQSPLEIHTCRLRRDVVDHITQGFEDRIFAGVNSSASEVWFMYPDKRDDDGANTECSRIAVFNYVDPEQPWWTLKLPRTAWMPAGVFSWPVGFAPDGTIYFHEKGTTADGADIEAYLETGAFDIEDGEFMLNINGFRPDFKSLSGEVEVTLSVSLDQNSSYMQEEMQVATPTKGYLPFRMQGRQGKLRFESTGAKWRLGASRLDVTKTGAKW